MRFTLVFLCLNLATVTLPARADVKDQVLQDWAERRAGLQSARFVVKSSITVKAGSKGPSEKDSRILLPLADYTYDEHRTIVVDLVRGRLRREIRGQRFMHGGGLDRFRSYVEYEVFDGKAVGVVYPKEENESDVYKPSRTQPELALYTEGQLQRMLTSDDVPIIASIGTCIPFWKRREATSLLHNESYSRFFHWPTSASDGAGAFVLRATGSRQGDLEEWRLAPDRASALTSVRVFDAGKPWIVVDVQYDTSSPPMPKRWTTSRLKNRSATDLKKISELVSYERNPAISEGAFTIPLKGKEIIVKDGRLHRATEDGKFVPTTRTELHRQLNSSSMGGIPVAVVIGVVSVIIVGVAKQRFGEAV